MWAESSKGWVLDSVNWGKGRKQLKTNNHLFPLSDLPRCEPAAGSHALPPMMGSIPIHSQAGYIFSPPGFFL